VDRDNFTFTFTGLHLIRKCFVDGGVTYFVCSDLVEGVSSVWDFKNNITIGKVNLFAPSVEGVRCQVPDLCPVPEIRFRY
jgi:hypothetical protein